MLMMSKDRPYPLTAATDGEQVKIAHVNGGSRLTKRLFNMGLFEGVEVDVIMRQTGGAVVMRCHGARLALGVGMAHKIQVTRIQEEQDDE
jgi:Fe2+ transport system protein FeoA